MVSCFVSYTSADAAWAEWVAAVLREAGHRVTVQVTDFLPGENFVLRMQEAASESDHTVVIMSEAFLASRFGASEWAAAFVQDPEGKHRRLIPIAVERVSPPGLWAAIVRVSVVGLDEDDARELVLGAITPGQRPVPIFPGQPSSPNAGIGSTEQPVGQMRPRRDIGGPGPSPSAPNRPQVDVWRLSTPPTTMVGRTAETEILTRAWLGENENVVSIAGWGGVGKTTLVGNWLAEMAAYQYHGARSVFAWSFDGQSDQDNWATSDQFFDALVRFLGIEDAVASATTWQRCRTVLTELQRVRSLVVLDGVERVQHPPGALEGTFREPVMQMFVRELAAQNAGMLVITSRLAIIDVDPYVGRTCTNIAMPALSRAESVQILVNGGVRGDISALAGIAEEVRDHPLSLRLLSGYLSTVYDGDARMWESSGLAKAVVAEGGNTSAIMDQYAAWFRGRPEFQLLRLLGLFNRAATEEELATLRDLPVFEGLNDDLADMSRADMAYTLASLQRTGMVERSATRDVIEAHPLVRDYFHRTFRAEDPSAFSEGHRRLSQFLAMRAAVKPSSLAECAPVLDAIWHATRAGENALTLDTLYWPRLAQEHHFLRDGLGAAASNHAVITFLLDDTGGPPLDECETARLLADQSLDLRMMGNTAEALRPLNSAVQITRRLGDKGQLVNELRHLSQLQLTLSKIDLACRNAEEAVLLVAGREPGDLESLSARTSYASALLHAGRYQSAFEQIDDCGFFHPEAEEIFATPARRVTFCIAAYRACDTLLGLGQVWNGPTLSQDYFVRCAESVLAVASSAAAGTTAGRLGTALLKLAGSRLLGADATEPGAELLAALETIHRVGQRPWMIEANLVLCRREIELGDLRRAVGALDLAARLAREDSAILQQLQCRLERSRIAALAPGLGGADSHPKGLAADAARLGLIFLEDRARRV